LLLRRGRNLALPEAVDNGIGGNECPIAIRRLGQLAADGHGIICGCRDAERLDVTQMIRDGILLTVQYGINDIESRPGPKADHHNHEKG